MSDCVSGTTLTEIDGRLGRLPKLIGTSLEIHAKGPNLDFLRKVSGLKYLASEPFELSGHFDGDPQRFKTNALNLRFGSTDITGELRVDLEEKPRLTAKLTSNHVKVADFMPAAYTGRGSRSIRKHPQAIRRSRCPTNHGI